MAAANGYPNVTALNDADEFVLWQAGAVVNVTWSAFRGVIDDWFLPLTGGTLTGSLTVAPAAGAANSTLNAPAGSNAVQRFEENSVLRAAVFWNGTADTFIGVCYDTGGANAQNAWRATWNAGLDLYYQGAIKAQTVANGLNVVGYCAVQNESVTPTNAGSASAAANTQVLVLNHASDIATYTINFPSSPIEGQVFTIAARSGVTTTLTLGTGSASITGSISTIAAGGFASWTYMAGANRWYRCG